MRARVGEGDCVVEVGTGGPPRGLLLTLGATRVLPGVVGVVGWRWAFASIVIGPILGSLAMWRLMRSPEAEKLAGGRG